jgi:hypothetical protein
VFDHIRGKSSEVRGRKLIRNMTVTCSTNVIAIRSEVRGRKLIRNMTVTCSTKVIAIR